MPLKVELKPGEKIVLGQAIITNGDHRTRFTLDGNAPMLREKDILTPATANTPAKLIYLCIQTMYLEQDVNKYHDEYFKLMSELLTAAPSLSLQISAVNNQILTSNLYKGLKEAKPLILKEEEILNHVRTSSDNSLPGDGENSDNPT